MSWKETLNNMSSQIYERMGQEWDAARESLAATFDTRLRTMETLYSRDTTVSSAINHDQAAPMGPGPQQEPEVEPER